MLLRRHRPDAYFVLQTLSGRREAFSELVHRYCRSALTFAYARVDTYSDAEEVAQESLVLAFEKLDTLRDPDKFGPWLFGIVRNCASRVYARRRTEVSWETAAAETPAVRAVDHSAEEGFAEVRRLVDALPAAQREIVILYYFAGCATREIATRLEMSPAAVRKQLERARKELGRRMIERASASFAWNKDFTKATLALIAATVPAWLGGEAAAAIALSTQASFSVSVLKFALGATAVLALGWAGLSAVQRTSAVNSSADDDAPLIAAASPRDSTATPPVALAEVDASAAAAVPAESPRATQTAAAPENDGLALSVLVSDRNGDPVEGASVTVRIRGNILEPNQHPDLLPALDKATAKSGPGGRCRFTDVNTNGLSQFVVEIQVGGTGYAGFTRLLLSSMESGILRHEVVVRDTEVLSAKVTDANGGPVAGAVFRPIDYEPRGSSSAWVMPDLPAITTDSNGRLSTDRLYAGRWKFLVSAPGFAAQETGFIETGDPAAIQLAHGVRLAGRIDFASPSIPEASFRLALAHKEQYYEVHAIDIDASSTRFEFTSLRPGTYYVWTDDPGLIVAGADTIEIGANATAISRDISFVRGGAVQGRLVDAATREGIARVPVTAQLRTGAENRYASYRRATTDEEGRFTIVGLAAGEHVIACVHGLPPVAGGRNWPQALVSIAVGATATLPDLTIERKYQLRGTVVDRNGLPVPNVGVELRPRGEGETQSMLLQWYADPMWHLTNDRGEFQIYFAEPVSDLYLRALGPGQISREAGPFTIGPSPLVARLVLEEAGSISGRLVGRSGRAESGRGMTVTGADTGPQFTTRWDSTLDRLTLDPHLSTQLTGRFYLGPLVSDTYVVSTSDNPGGVRVTLAPGEQRDDVDVPIYRSVEPTISGTVTLLGRPAAGCYVSFSGDQTRTGDDGAFTLAERAGDRSDTLSVSTYGSFDGVETRRSLNVTGEALTRMREPLLIELGRGPSAIEGRILLNGRPWSWLNLSIETTWSDGVTESVHSSTNPDGHYRLEGLPAGTNRIELSARPAGSTNRGLRPIEVVLAAGGTERRDIHFEAGVLRVKVSGMRAGERGLLRLIPGTEVITELSEGVVQQMGADAEIEVPFDGDEQLGVYVMEPGPYVLYVAAYDAAADGLKAILSTVRFQSLPVEVVTGQSASLTVDIARGPSEIEVAPF